jgi:transposase
MEIAHPGYNSQGEFSPQVHIIFIHALNLQLPIYYRIVGGDIREVRAFRLTLEESGIRDAVLIGDKGFYSEQNIAWLEEESLHYVLPLRRNSALIDYTPNEQPGKRGFDGYIKYHDRYIWYASRPQGENRVVHFYLDERLKGKEESDYLKRIETHPEEYSKEKFHESQFSFGTLALLTNVPSQSAEETYHQYKGRNGIEQIIDTMKNTLQGDGAYMRDAEMLEGWMFVTFLCLQWHYRIYRLLSEKELHSQFSPEDLVDRLAEIKKLRINDTWHTSEITAKTKKLLEKLEAPIT